MKKLHSLVMKNDKGGYNFAGVEISEYGQEHNKVDYRTLAKVVDDLILNNEIINYDFENWETTNGNLCEMETIYFDEDYNEIDEEEAEELRKQGKKVIEEEQESGTYKDIFQYYIISPSGADFLERYTDEIVFYNENLDVYLWGIDHLGTSWDYVLTEINIIIEDDAPTFINDNEKMRDFKIMTKDDFLKFYSYLTEEEYEATKIEYEKEAQ